MKKGFSLVEMLVVIGIIAVLTGGVIGAYSHLTKVAEKTRCKETVQNTATALVALFQEKGAWPKRLRAARTEGGAKILDENAAYPLARGGYLSLTTDETKLSGYDKFGIVSPWATAVIKRRGSNASVSDPVPGGGTIQDHILRFEIDLDGDGIIPDVSVGGESISVRATAIVWCCGKDGKIEAYARGLKRDDVYSWSYGQTQNVK